jgi:hypothetical protein
VRLNPYSTSPAAPPPLLAGRDELLHTFRGYIDALSAGYPAEVLLLHGLRGMGKTVLLQAFREMARERGWHAERVEASAGDPLSAQVAVELAAIGETLAGRARRLRDRIRSTLDDLTVTVGLPGVKGELSLGERTKTDVSFARLVNLVAEAARDRKVGVALLLDELQEGDPASIKMLARAMQSAASDRLPLLVAGGGLPTMPDHVRSAVTYGERYRFMELGPLTATAVRAALEQPARSEGVTFETKALALLVARSEGFPYLVQLHGRLAWEAAGGADFIDLGHARAAVRLAAEQLVESVFRGRWSRLTPAERRYVITMASLGDGPIRTAEIASAHGPGVTTSDLAPHRAAIITKGVVMSRERGTLEFTMPGLAAFIRAETPNPI